MKIQEALSKVKELKGDAFTLLTEAQQKEAIIYLGIEDKHNNTEAPQVDSLIDNALSKLAYAHDLKLAIQKSNALVGITDLIQEMDFLKMVCGWLEPLTKIEPESSPKLSNDFRMSTTEAIYIKTIATFNTTAIKNLYDDAVNRIRAIELELQQKNWEIDIDNVYTEGLMKVLAKLTE